MKYIFFTYLFLLLLYVLEIGYFMNVKNSLDKQVLGATTKIKQYEKNISDIENYQNGNLNLGN